jgi:16S rRNA (cytidine1402-2'-O)-methyltransferase
MVNQKKNSIKYHGTLYICGTPIGNLSDITIRALQTLKSVDLIAAEDTRHTQKLLNFYAIKKDMTSYHEHNKLVKTPYLISLLKKDKKIALVSDAGMPGISDPGYVLINAAIEEGIDIVPVPGVSACLTALIASGLASDSFIFEGFLAKRKGDRRKYLSINKNERRTIIIYESPYRVKKTLLDMLEIWGDRNIILARELTKKFEEILRGRISEVLNGLSKREIKGEITLVVQGNEYNTSRAEDEMSGDKLFEEFLVLLIEKGYSNKKIFEKVKTIVRLSKNKVYQLILKIKNKMDLDDLASHNKTEKRNC